MSRPRYLPDNFTLALIATVALASLLPASGDAAGLVERLAAIAIGLLFFVHGAKLPREAIVAGVGSWRLHLLVFSATFVLFPLLGLALRPLLSPLVTPALYVGVMYLCVLPATVQSAIAFTSMARGNVPAAICSASASTMLGVFLTPLLVGLLVVPGHAGAGSLDAIGRIVQQLMLPFVAGHLLRPWIGAWVKRRASALTLLDRGSILLVVYSAFSAAMIQGLWKQVPASALAALLMACALLLALALAASGWAARRLGFGKADEITIVFCGAKKSLASGIPMAHVLFAPEAVGAIVLPVMLFHQMQLMVCAVLAQRYARRPQEPEGAAPAQPLGTAAAPR